MVRVVQIGSDQVSRRRGKTLRDLAGDRGYNQEFVRYGTGKGMKPMNEEMFQHKLSELIAEIATLPTGERDKLELLAEQTRERHRQLKETVSSLQESIDFVRLSIKYMLFDLEATRRENQQLRKMLDESSQS